MHAPILKPTLPAKPGFLAVRTAAPPAKPPAPAVREEDGFLRPLVGSRVRVSGTFGAEWHGLLLAVTKFEIRLELADGSRPVLLKHAIASVTPVEEVKP